MKTLHISVELQSPIVMPKYPIHLDALLYEALNENSDMDKDTIISLLDGILDKENGVYKASAMRFLKSNDFPVTTFEWALATRTHWEDWQYSEHEKAKSIITKGGGFRKRVTTYDATLAKYVDFHAVGDANKIKFLLEMLGFIGRLNKQGFGQIASINISDCDQDYSFFDENGVLARCLPINLVNEDIRSEYLQIINAVSPPYKYSERVPSLLPSFRIKRIH